MRFKITSKAGWGCIEIDLPDLNSVYDFLRGSGREPDDFLITIIGE